jgi:hypothetical protein
MKIERAAALSDLEERLRHEMQPPDLQELVRRFGTYDQITPEAWAAFDAEMANWKARLANGDFSRPPYSQLPK